MRHAIFGVLLCWLSQTSLSNSELEVTFDEKKLKLSSNEWAFLPEEASYSINLQRIPKAKEMYPMVVTIFKMPMSEDRKKGRKLTANEWLELFSVHKNAITMRVRVDKGTYWVLSRQTFKPEVTSNLQILDQYTVPESQELLSPFDKALIDSLQHETDETRFLLKNSF